MALEQPERLPKLREVYAERVWPCGEWAKPRPSQFLCFCDATSRLEATAPWEQQLSQFQTDGHRHDVAADYVFKAWSRPGIYVLVDSQDRQPRYVGQTGNLRARLDAWFLYTRRPFPPSLSYRADTPVAKWLVQVPKSPLVWTPWLPTQGWKKERGRTRMGSPARRWDVTVEPWLTEQLVRAEARAIAHFRAQGIPLLNVQLRETLL